MLRIKPCKRVAIANPPFCLQLLGELAINLEVVITRSRNQLCTLASQTFQSLSIQPNQLQ